MNERKPIGAMAPIDATPPCLSQRVKSKPTQQGSHAEATAGVGTRKHRANPASDSPGGMVEYFSQKVEEAARSRGTDLGAWPLGTNGRGALAKYFKQELGASTSPLHIRAMIDHFAARPDQIMAVQGPVWKVFLARRHELRAAVARLGLVAHPVLSGEQMEASFISQATASADEWERRGRAMEASFVKAGR